MDAVSKSIFDIIINEWKSLSEFKKQLTINAIGYDIDSNVEKLKSVLNGYYDVYGFDSYPLDWFLQWVPYADEQTQSWVVDYLNYLSNKDNATEYDIMKFDGADYFIKRNLLLYCQPIISQIEIMCENQTLYN